MLRSCLDVDDPPAFLDLWGTQGANIGDPGLKTRGEERITSTRKEYEGIVSGLRQAATALDPFLKGLTDQITFLGSDLRPEALEQAPDTRHDRRQHIRHIRRREPLGRTEAQVCAVSGKHPVDHERMDVHIEIQRPAEALDDRDRSAAPVRDSRLSGHVA